MNPALETALILLAGIVTGALGACIAMAIASARQWKHDEHEKESI